MVVREGQGDAGVSRLLLEEVKEGHAAKTPLGLLESVPHKCALPSHSRLRGRVRRGRECRVGRETSV
jgi:hypothetical protein